MPGAMSDRDREFLEGMVPGLSKTKAGRQLIVQTSRKMAQRDVEVAKLAADWRRERKTMDGFTQHLAEWSKKNPLFTEADFEQFSQASKVIDLSDADALSSMEARAFASGLNEQEWNALPTEVQNAIMGKLGGK